MWGGETLIACPACSCHGRAEAVECPHCGAALRTAGGAVEPTRGAILLGLIAAMVAPVGASCESSDPRASSARAAGTGGADGSGGGGSAEAVTSVSTASYASNQVSSSYGAGPTSDWRCGSLAFDDPACDECAFYECCDELLACDVGTSCYDLVDCYSSCGEGDAACAEQCEADFAVGAEAFDALLACATGPCEAHCGTGGGTGGGGAGGSGAGGGGAAAGAGGSGGSGGSGPASCEAAPATGDAACEACLAAKCCPEFEACVDPDPSACADCLAGQAPCDPDGLAADACRSMHCATDCNY